jgi:hypothetical protein
VGGGGKSADLAGRIQGHCTGEGHHLAVAATAASVARWQKFRPKSSKGAADKKSWPKEFVAEFWLILPKRGRKGAAENFQKKFLIFSCDNHYIMYNV